MRYKIENLSSVNGDELQTKVKNFLNNKKITSLVSVNIWSDNIGNYATIIYCDAINL